jgi:CBS domain-containing protein
MLEGTGADQLMTLHQTDPPDLSELGGNGTGIAPVTLAVMANRHVRRLPVLDTAGALQGVLSMDDLVLHAETPEPSHTPALSSRDVLQTLRTIYGSRRVRVAAAPSAA